MRAPSTRAPPNSGLCILCVHRLQATRTPFLLQRAPSRCIQTTYSARRPAQATATAKAEAEDGSGQTSEQTQAQHRTIFNRNRQTWVPHRTGEATSRELHNGSGQRRGSDQHSGSGPGRPLQRPLVRKMISETTRPMNENANVNPRRRSEAQPQAWRHVNRSAEGGGAEGGEASSAFQPKWRWREPQETTTRAPDPWSLNIPSNRPASPVGNKIDITPAYDMQESLARAAKEREQTSSFQVQRDRYRQERSDRTDRLRRTKDRQKGMHESRFGQRSYGQDEDMDADQVDRIDAKRKRKEARRRQMEKNNATPILLPDYISVGNLAGALKVSVNAFTKKLQQLGFDEVTVDHIIDAETAGLVATEFGFEPTLPKQDVEEDIVAQPEPTGKNELPNRPPVVTIMGHVDHGKTTLLDWLRKSSVVASEHGGITQHIGAFTVPMPSGRVITFLDTPGHAAFLDMRARGANVTDIVILVVAADDSVKPQTLEAIKHAQDANVPMIVAINKVDKAEADPQKVKTDLARHGVSVEDFGGDVQTVQVSGKTGQGMEDLEEAALALADILDARAPTDGSVEGRVIESTAGKAGKVATVLVRRGTLSPGAVLVAGTTWTRVRTLHDANGAVVETAGPGVPVVVDGWREQPDAGDEVLETEGEQRAKRAIDFRLKQAEDRRMAADVSSLNQARSEEAASAAAAAESERSGDDAATRAEAAAQKARSESSGMLELPLILRGDVSGSVEALDASIQALSSSLIKPVTLRALVGPATPSDVFLAELTGATLVSFNVAVPNAIAQKAERAQVPLVSGNVIYQLVDAVRDAMEDKLPEKIGRRVLGEATVLEVFQIGLGGGRGKLPVAGVRIGNGALKQGGRVRILRGGDGADPEASDLGGGRKGAKRSTKGDNGQQQGERIVYDGRISTLRHHKKEVMEMRKGTECGVSFDDNFADFEQGDRVQVYEETREKQRLR